MIKKLKQRISWLIMISLSIIIIGIIILFTVFNYNSTINTANFMMDRFMGEDPKRSPDGRLEDYKIKQESNIDGVYNFLVEDSDIVQNSMSKDKTLNEYALKIAKKKSDKGIIGKYVYKVRKINHNIVKITFIESEEAVSRINIIFIFSMVMSIAALIAIYIISQKVSKMIVKPVEETFEKQKQFISDASHELKTPLAVIEANADVLENEMGTNKWINYIQNEIESMNTLINELLLLAKIENVDNIKERKPLNISKELEIMLSMFESMAYEKQVKIKSNIAEDIIMNVNKEDIEHIVSTLTDNAIKHTKEQGDIEVVLRKVKNEIILEVKNMGDPIPKEEREKIFERFYRIDKSRNRSEKRYGLGLAIAKSTIEQYNGKIEVFYKDNYTIFRVTIPNQ